MVVYKLTNKINGKSYVGQTIHSMEARLKRHASNYSGCTAISSAIKKYGIDNFDVSILCECLTLEDLNTAESRYILSLNTLAPHGYNLSMGGGNRQWSTVVKDKISLKNKGRKHSQEFRQMRAAIQTGKLPTEVTKLKMSTASFGKKKSESHKKNISEGKRGSSLPLEVKEKIRKTLQRPIKRNETGEIFACAADAAKACQIGKSTVLKILKGRKQSFKGFSFSYA